MSTCSKPATNSVISVPAARDASLLTSPSAAVTTSTTLGSSWPNCSSRASVGRDGLGAGGFEPTGDQVLGDAAAEHGGGDGEDAARRSG